MTAKHLLVALFATTFAAAALGAGCGGSSSDSGTDGGGDATTDGKGDTGNGPIDGASGDDAATACVDADLANLSVADASLGDAGGSVGLCVSCSKAACGSFITQCNADCDCRDAAVQFYECVGKGGQLLACGFSAFGGLSGKSAQVGQNLGLCIYAGCKDECGLPNLDGGGDANHD